jgi:putative oxidoreductase
VFSRSKSLKADNLEQAILPFREEYRLPLLRRRSRVAWRPRLNYVRPACSWVSLCTRLATLPLTITIQFLVYSTEYPSHLLWLALLLFILVRGPARSRSMR